jgi:hypothetical protein
MLMGKGARQESRDRTRLVQCAVDVPNGAHWEGIGATYQHVTDISTCHRHVNMSPTCQHVTNMSPTCHTNTSGCRPCLPDNSLLCWHHVSFGPQKRNQFIPRPFSVRLFQDHSEGSSPNMHMVRVGTCGIDGNRMSPRMESACGQSYMWC